VLLPNSQSYSFKYNKFGDVAELHLPTGGFYRYTYDTVLGGARGAVNVYTITRRLTQKKVFLNATDTEAVHTITYDNGLVTHRDASGPPSVEYQYPSGQHM